MITLRVAHAETDYPRIAALLTLTSRLPVSVEDLHSWDQVRDSGTIRRRSVAVDGHGAVVGYSMVYRDHHDAERQRFYLYVVVDPDHRQHSLGTRLYEDAAAFARDHGARSFTSEVRDNDPAGLHFMEQHGFRVQRHSFASRLDLATFNETPFKDLVEQVVISGIRFSTLAAEGNMADAQWKVWRLNNTTAQDNPSNDGEPFPEFTDFQQYVLRAPWFRPEGQILAIDGEHYVGLGAISLVDQTAYSAFTGVDRAYRGRGIAQALKLLTIRYARVQGATELRTDNDSANAAMLAINRKFGFVPEPGTYFLIRDPL